MSEDLARRVHALEDRWEISELVAQYGRAVDDRDFDTLGEMYTADAVFDSVGGRTTGRRSVIDYYRARTAAYGATYHYPHSNEIELVDPDRARGVVCAHAELAVGDESVFVALRYLDDYRREDGRWRFPRTGCPPAVRVAAVGARPRVRRAPAGPVARHRTGRTAPRRRPRLALPRATRFEGHVDTVYLVF